MTRTSQSSFTATALLVTLLCGSSLLDAQSRDRTPPTAPTNLTAVDAADNESEPGSISLVS